MSRHCFDTMHEGSPITVVLAWDRPMHYFFLTIENRSELVEDSMQFDFLYSNWYESDPFGHGLDYYREVLRRFQIVVPESMFTEVFKDFERNIGNRVVTHQADGSFTERMPV